MLREFYREEDVTVYWDESNNWIYSDWRNIPNVQTVKNGCKAILDLLTSKRAQKILNDNSNVTGPWNAAGDWVANEWFPQAIGAGLKHFAWIQSPHSMLSQIAAEKSEKKNEGDIIKMFENKADAEKWLIGR